MAHPQRQDDRLYPAKVFAGGLTAVLLGGLFYIAIDRDSNHEYIAPVAVALAGVVAGVMVSLVRRFRRWLTEVGSKSWIGVSAAMLVFGLAAAAIRKIVRTRR